MKYMIMMFGSAAGLMETRSTDWIKEMIQFMKQLDVDLTNSGELVFNAGLADRSAAKTVRLEDGLPVATDGPFAESKESLIGYWVVDVESEARAIEISSRIVEYSGVVEVRQVMDAPPEVWAPDARSEGLLSELAPQALGILVRRSGQFDACEDAVQEALFAARLTASLAEQRYLALKAARLA
jgi:hypothetical protein